MSKIVAIDPSINNIGIAIDHDGKLNCFTIHSKGRTDIEKARYIANKIIENFVFSIGHYDIYLETPDSWTRSGKNVQSLMKLSMSIGAIIGALRDFDIHCIPVSKWKGTEHKMTPELFKAMYPDWPAINEHERDAVGLLNYVLKEKNFLTFIK